MRRRRPRLAPNNLPKPRHWSEDAACKDTPTEEFFPTGTDGVPAKIQAEYAKGFCRICPVASACLTYALTAREDYGVWGGFDEAERTELLRQARRDAERTRRRAREAERAAAAGAA